MTTPDPHLPPVSDQFLSSAVAARSKRLSHEEMHRLSAAYYNEQIGCILDFLRKERFQVAEELFMMLLELKAGQIRKDGYTPEYGHQIDQILPLITSLQRGGLKNDRAAIERQHGSVEKWINAIIVHDMGEDDGLFPENLEQALIKRVTARHKRVSSKNQSLIERAARSMERLTHYRKLTPETAEQITGLRLPVLDFQDSDFILLPEEMHDAFADKMRLTSSQKNDLQVFAVKKSDPDGAEKIQIIVSQYTPKNFSLSADERSRFGTDWNLYIFRLLCTARQDKARGLEPEEEDFYDFLTKMGDSNQGMGSRIAIRNFTLQDYGEYLRNRNTMFSTQSASNMAIECFYKGSRLLKTVESLDHMMGGLYDIGDLFIQYHPENNPNGGRGIDIQRTLEFQQKEGINPLFFSRRIPKTHYYYGQTPVHSHPVAMLMRQLREYEDSSFSPAQRQDQETLYKLLKAAIVENGNNFTRLFEQHIGGKTALDDNGSDPGDASADPVI